MHSYTTETWYFQISNNQWVNVDKYITAQKHNFAGNNARAIDATSWLEKCILEIRCCNACPA
jgi:hypothetical protein